MYLTLAIYCSVQIIIFFLIIYDVLLKYCSTVPVYLAVVKLGGDLTAESSTDDEPTSKVSKVWYRVFTCGFIFLKREIREDFFAAAVCQI